MFEGQNLWNQVREKIKTSFSSDTFEQTFEDVKMVAKEENGTIYVLVPSMYIQRKINSMYYRDIERIAQELSPKKVKILFVRKEEIQEAPKKDFSYINVNNLNMSFTFDSFILGNSNALAFKSAMKVVETPGVINPLYLFGSVGLGKTHLMQAIGNAISASNVEKKVLYIQASDYLTDYIKASRDKTIEEFEAKYNVNNIDVLLVDDIQMLSGKNGTQQMFFQLFNDMITNRKQIVITSDVKADDLSEFPERLVSRFQSGMTANIGHPDLEQRVQILKRKAAETTQININDDIFYYIAEQFTDNVRELEGALTRFILYLDTWNGEPNLQMAKEALEILLKSKPKKEKENYEAALSVIAATYNVTVADILGSSRKANIVLARHISCYILYNNYNMKYEKIGQLMGGRDHSTILNGVNKIETELKTDQELKMAVEMILKKVD